MEDLLSTGPTLSSFCRNGEPIGSVNFDLNVFFDKKKIIYYKFASWSSILVFLLSSIE